MERKTKNLKTKNTTVLILSEGKAKKCKGGGSETIFFSYLKTKSCLQKFVKIKDAKSKCSDPGHMIKEAKQLLQDGTCSKLYLVFDYDNQTQKQLIQIEKSIQEINKLQLGIVERIASYPCFEVLFLFDNLPDSKIISTYHAVEKELNRKISDLLLQSKIKNSSLDEYRYSEDKKADHKYLQEKLYPLLDFKRIYQRLRAIDIRSFDSLLQLIQLCAPFTEIANITEIITCNVNEK